MAFTVDDVLIGSQFLQPHRSTGMEFLRTDADFSTEAETTAVRETRRGVDVDCRCIDIVQEVLCRLVMIGDDHFRVACAVFLDMRDGIVIGGNHFDCQNEI